MRPPAISLGARRTRQSGCRHASSTPAVRQFRKIWKSVEDFGTYDAVGRVTGESLVDLSNVTKTRTRSYDAAGRLKTYVTGYGTVSYTYDGSGRVLTKTVPGSRVMAYTYDAAGR